MKRLSFILIIAVICSVMVSCNKEGRYNPKKKISQVSFCLSEKDEMWNGHEWVTTREYSNPEYVGQVWNWKGNQLESVDFYEADGQLMANYHFVYKNAKITTIECNGGESRYEFVYKNGLLTTMEFYSGSTCDFVYEYTYSKGKIQKIVFTPLSGKSAVTQELLPVELLAGLPPLPDEDEKALRDDKREYYFYWDGDNVEQLAFRQGSYAADYYFTYDKMLNPLRGVKLDQVASQLFYASFPLTMSKNNISRCIVESNGGTDVYDHAYTYDGKYPVVMTWISTREYTVESVDAVMGDGRERMTIYTTRKYVYE